MDAALRRLAWAVAGMVVVQAGLIAFGKFSTLHALEDGHRVTLDSVNDNGGDGLHWLFGQILIPLLVIALVVLAAVGRRSGRLPWTLALLGLVVVQLLLAYAGESVPGLGALHGMNAFAILAVAVKLARWPNRHPRKETSGRSARASAA